VAGFQTSTKAGGTMVGAVVVHLFILDTGVDLIVHEPNGCLSITASLASLSRPADDQERAIHQANFRVF
jgi:hypothetical protein